jgi:hypothetical protein
MTNDYEREEQERAILAAASPVGDLINRVWEVADDPDEDARLAAELDGAIRVHIIRAAAGTPPQGWDSRMLAGVCEFVAKALAEQHRFTGTVTRRACMAPYLDLPPIS